MRKEQNRILSIWSLVVILITIVSFSHICKAAGNSLSYRNDLFTDEWIEKVNKRCNILSLDQQLYELAMYINSAPESVNLIESDRIYVQKVVDYISEDTGLTPSELIRYHFCVIDSPLASETLGVCAGYSAKIADEAVEKNEIGYYTSIATSAAAGYGLYMFSFDPNSFSMIDVVHCGYYSSFPRQCDGSIVEVQNAFRSDDGLLLNKQNLTAKDTEILRQYIHELSFLDEQMRNNSITQEEAWSHFMGVSLLYGSKPVEEYVETNDIHLEDAN